MWQLPVTWVVVAETAVGIALRRPPADAFFDVVEHLEDFDAARARNALERRGVHETSAAELATMAATSPRNLLDHARQSILHGATPSDLQVREVDFQRRLGDVSRSAAMLAVELRGQSAVSASDEDLQQRMGWTRPRLTQVLKELEAAGLAQSAPASDGRAGRPRRLYEIVGP